MRLFNNIFPAAVFAGVLFVLGIGFCSGGGEYMIIVFDTYGTYWAIYQHVDLLHTSSSPLILCYLEDNIRRFDPEPSIPLYCMSLCLHRAKKV